MAPIPATLPVRGDVGKPGHLHYQALAQVEFTTPPHGALRLRTARKIPYRLIASQNDSIANALKLKAYKSENKIADAPTALATE
jgi:hypothetical protein